MGLQAAGRQRFQHAPDHLPGETTSLPCRKKQTHHALFKQIPALINKKLTLEIILTS